MNLLGRAELIHILAERGPAFLATAAKLAGYEATEEQLPATTEDVSLPSGTTTTLVSRRQQEETGPAVEKVLQIPFWRVTRCEYNQAVLATDTGTEEALPAVEWSGRCHQPASAAPLSPWPRLLPYLRRAAMDRTPGTHLDLPKIIHRLSRSEYLQRLPRKHHLVWSTQIHIVLDHSNRLIPYWGDQAQVAAQLAQLLPVTVFKLALYWEGLQEPVFADEHAGKYRLPAPGGLVLVLSDLGQLATDKATAHVWQRFGERLVNSGCRVLALLPCRQCVSARAPPWQILAWERQGSRRKQNPTELVERLLTLLSPAVRIEPGLLREARRRLGADASVESLFWQHPELSSNSNEAASLAPMSAKHRRQDFDKLENSERLALLRLIREWRHTLPQEIWFEECCLSPATRALLLQDPELDKDAREAEAFFARLGQDFAAGVSNAGARAWYRRMEKRIPTPDAHAETLRPALNRMWHAVHHNEPNAKPPVGYDPAHIPSQAPLRTLQVFQQGEHILLLEASHPGAANVERGASWLGTLQTRNGQISLEDKSLFWQGEPPAWASDWGKDKYGLWVEFIVWNVTQRMRWIPPGQFLMGSPKSEPERWNDEGPQHEVTLSKGFWLFDTAVTQALWEAVMANNSSHFKGPDRPVERVTWDDAKAFINQLNSILSGLELSLPSEAQWEYACRAGTQTLFYFGDNITPEQVNYNGDYPYNNAPKGLYRKKTVVVKSFPPNSYGLYEMHGNVWEWCEDYWSNQYSAEAQIDPTGPTSGGSRVVRGGSWGGGARDARAASRSRLDPGDRDFDLGFRCARVQREHKLATQAEPVASTQAARKQRMEQSGASALLQMGIASAYTLPWPRTEAFILRADANALHVSSMVKPAWAKDTGRDHYGLWAEFQLDNIIQRLRWIPPGQFLMGSPTSEAERWDNEGPQHAVTLTEGFWLFDTAVTQALWGAVMGKNPSKFKGPDRPVENVTWNDCQAFLKAINTRLPGLALTLPTEAQWEYACRAGTQTPFYFGDNITPRQVNYDGNYPYNNASKGLTRRKTVPVKSLLPNSWGLYEMHGNVLEWCLDGQREYTNAAQEDPLGPVGDGSSRVIRGGSWDKGARRVRAAYRFPCYPGGHSNDLGFRCARVQA